MMERNVYQTGLVVKKMPKIIDFEVKGNCVKFYLGANDCEDYWGDDWNDIPYEHNADRVYDEYIVGTRTFYFDYNDAVYEPCNGRSNSCLSKQDMKERKVPCVIVTHNKRVPFGSFDFYFRNATEDEEWFYFGDYLLPGISYETNELNIFIPQS